MAILAIDLVRHMAFAFHIGRLLFLSLISFEINPSVVGLYHLNPFLPVLLLEFFGFKTPGLLAGYD